MIDQGNSYYQLENPGYLRISGLDRLDFLQRQTTNDMRRLSSEHPLVTVLTSPSGRILDILWVFDEGNDSYGVLTLPGQGAQTTDFLNARIFFKDKVSIENLDNNFLQFDLFGEGNEGILRELGTNTEPENFLSDFMLEDVPVMVLMNHQLGHRLLAPSDHQDQIISAFAEHGLQPISPEEYQIQRIENGIPAAGHELVEDYTPLEIGFRWAISDNKGCYTGQEVIARQVNYEKVTRHLVGLRLENITGEIATLYSQENDQPVGKITSVTSSPRFGPIALAVVKRPFHEPGIELFFRTEEQKLQGLTTELPFQ